MSAGPEERALIMEKGGIDLGDYMDVVTTYQCKFCSHVCHTIKDMTSHVQTAHIKPKRQETLEQVQNVTEKSQRNDKVKVISEVIERTVQTSNLSDVDEDTRASSLLEVLESNGQNNGQNIKLAFKDQSTLAEPTNDNVMELDQTNTVTDIPIVPGANAGECVTFNIDGKIVEVALDNRFDKVAQPVYLKCDTDTEITETSDNQIPPENTETVISTSSHPITKELFLCGQCNSGFNSMEECQSHMLQEHDIVVDDGKVSVATQVDKVKHRKRKQERGEELDAKELDDSDVEWTVESEYISRGSRTRSKICPPKALKDDYYLGKTKTGGGSRADKSSSYRIFYSDKCVHKGCNAKFSSEKAMDLHMKCHTSDDSSLKCSECKTDFQKWRQLRLHLWKVHKLDTDLLICDICEYRTDTVSRLKIHQEIHSQDKPYTCDTCGKCFRQLSQMKNHQILHTESQDPDKWYSEKECDICNRKFANTKCLLVHKEAVHGDNKPFVCATCGYATARKAQLELHARTHTQEKPFKCDACSYTTGDHNSLRRHKMRHTGQKPYKCPHCPYSCIQAICFKTHMKNKHFGAKGIFCCELCPFKSVNEQKYNNHVKDHKNGLISASPRVQTKRKHEPTFVFGPRITPIGENATNMELINQENIAQNTITMGDNSGEQDMNQIQMQVETMDTGERTISRVIRVEDLPQLSQQGLITSDLSQLITYAMNSISQENVDTDNNVQTSSNNSGVTTHTFTFHLPPAEQTTDIDYDKQEEAQRVGTVSNITEVIESPNIVSTINTGDIQLQQSTDNASVLLNFQGTNIPVNLIQIDGGQAGMTVPQNATIQDLAQVSCLVKDSLFNGTTYCNLDSRQTEVTANVIENKDPTL